MQSQKATISSSNLLETPEAFRRSLFRGDDRNKMITQDKGHLYKAVKVAQVQGSARLKTKSFCEHKSGWCVTMCVASTRGSKAGWRGLVTTSKLRSAGLLRSNWRQEITCRVTALAGKAVERDRWFDPARSHRGRCSAILSARARVVLPR